MKAIVFVSGSLGGFLLGTYLSLGSRQESDPAQCQKKDKFGLVLEGKQRSDPARYSHVDTGRQTVAIAPHRTSRIMKVLKGVDPFATKSPRRKPKVQSTLIDPSGASSLVVQVTSAADLDQEVDRQADRKKMSPADEKMSPADSSKELAGVSNIVGEACNNATGKGVSATPETPNSKGYKEYCFSKDDVAFWNAGTTVVSKAFKFLLYVPKADDEEPLTFKNPTDAGKDGKALQSVAFDGKGLVIINNFAKLPTASAAQPEADRIWEQVHKLVPSVNDTTQLTVAQLRKLLNHTNISDVSMDLYNSDTDRQSTLFSNIVPWKNGIVKWGGLHQKDSTAKAYVVNGPPNGKGIFYGTAVPAGQYFEPEPPVFKKKGSAVLIGSDIGSKWASTRLCQTREFEGTYLKSDGSSRIKVETDLARVDSRLAWGS